MGRVSAASAGRFVNTEDKNDVSRGERLSGSLMVFFEWTEM